MWEEGYSGGSNRDSVRTIGDNGFGEAKMKKSPLTA